MALNNLSLFPAVKKWSGQIFKNTVRVFDRYPSLNEKCIAELKELHPKYFAISDYQLREDYELRQAKIIGSKIRFFAGFNGLDMPVLSFDANKYTVNYKQQVIPYLDRILLSAIKRAVKYSAHKRDIQIQLEKVLSDYEN